MRTACRCLSMQYAFPLAIWVTPDTLKHFLIEGWSYADDFREKIDAAKDLLGDSIMKER